MSPLENHRQSHIWYSSILPDLCLGKDSWNYFSLLLQPWASFSPNSTFHCRFLHKWLHFSFCDFLSISGFCGRARLSRNLKVIRNPFLQNQATVVSKQYGFFIVGVYPNFSRKCARKINLGSFAYGLSFPTDSWNQHYFLNNLVFGFIFSDWNCR